MWQHAAFISAYATQDDPLNPGFMGVLNIIEFIWGLQFLRDSCKFPIYIVNFCISGATTEWYNKRQNVCYEPFQVLVTKHWGSVVGGSFFNAFFELPSLIIELLICHPQTCCGKCGGICHNSCNCLNFTDLIRTDSYTYTYMSGIPICNADRQCEDICGRSTHFIGSNSALKHYKFSAHVCCVSLAFLASYFVLKYRVWDYGFWHTSIVIVLIYMTMIFLIDIHGDTAEALQTNFLV